MASNLPSPEPALSDTASQPDEQNLSCPKTSAAVQSSSSLKAPEATCGHQTMTDHGALEKLNRSGSDARTKISNLLKEKEQEWTAVVQKKGPLRLLDLPIDVLRDIVKEVTHTNDLTALALAHSALHSLAIPHIYSRFDIVWPDAHATTDPRTGVDALTYGLATLCMGDVSTDHTRKQTFSCTKCGMLNTADCQHGFPLASRSGQRRLGNQYPQFTRKFSLGNGPADWVQEYLITKESGKMLGTLVALAVARMVNLETFVWDMPTGVLRDVWLALSSLQNRHPYQSCRLERVWVRWHDNQDASNMSSTQGPNAPPTTTQQMLTGSTMSSVGWIIGSGSPLSGNHTPTLPFSYAQSRVEYPTLSVLPPLKSLSVLDIDELDYLDEMSILIARSKDKIRELRVGIAAKAVSRAFTLAWDGPDLSQVDHAARCPGASVVGNRRLGGVLGVLLGRVYDIRKRTKARPNEKKDCNFTVSSTTASNIPIPNESSSVEIPDVFHSGPEDLGHPEATVAHVIEQVEQAFSSPGHAQTGCSGENTGSAVTSNGMDSSSTFLPHVSLLEHPPVGVSESDDVSGNGNQYQSDAVSMNALISAHSHSDLDALSSLMAAHHIATDSTYHPDQGSHAEEALKRRSPSHGQRTSPSSEVQAEERERLDGKLRLQTLELERVGLSVAVLQKAFDWSVLTNLTILDCPQHEKLWTMLRRHFQPTTLCSNTQASAKHTTALQYHLNLNKIHTDAASPALIGFLRDTLAPNTLETLFLQDRRRSTATSITIDTIFRGPLKRHRTSLKKLMLDSSDKPPRSPTSSSENTRWRAWMPNREVLNFITSGKMTNLRELSIAIDYKDWHHFLQRLPLIPHVRSLNIPFIADHVTAAFDPRELALQVVDVIVLRPEVELCYMGVAHKCFEILENRPHDESHGLGDSHSVAAGGPGGTFTDDEDDDDEEATDEEEDENEEDGDGENATAIAPVDPDETESEMSDRDDSDADSFDGSDDDSLSKVRLRLREILFYDDKVSIFKARHGRL